jgi:hypothetical protein
MTLRQSVSSGLPVRSSCIVHNPRRVVGLLLLMLVWQSYAAGSVAAW